MTLTRLSEVRPGAVLADTIIGTSGKALLYAGVTLNETYLSELQSHGIPAVYVRDAETDDVEIPHAVSPEARGRALRNLSQAFEAVSAASEELRHASVETIQRHLQSDRFANAVRAAGGGQSIAALSGDVDGFLEQLMNREVLAGLNSIKSHDAYTFQHSIDVTIMGVVMARRLGWDRQRLKAFAMGCMLHDIGKIFIDPSILNKPGKLTDEEFARVKSHPELGREILRAFSGALGPLVPLVAHQHHERQDGTGYPRGLRGDNALGRSPAGMIHDFGAVCAVADVYDALASHRPYREPWPTDRVAATIRSMARTHLNRVAVDVFSKCVAPYPVSTTVRISGGRYAGHGGVVVKVYSTEPARPRVRVLRDAKGARVEPAEIDLRTERDVSLQCVPPAGEPQHPPANLSRAA